MLKDFLCFLTSFDPFTSYCWRVARSGRRQGHARELCVILANTFLRSNPVRIYWKIKGIHSELPELSIETPYLFQNCLKAYCSLSRVLKPPCSHRSPLSPESQKLWQSFLWTRTMISELKHLFYLSFSNVTVITNINGRTIIFFPAVTTTCKRKMIGAWMEYAQEHHTTACHVKRTTEVVANSNLDTAL